MTKLKAELREAQQKATTVDAALEAAETEKANAKREEKRLRKRVASLLPKGVSFDEYNARIAKLEDPRSRTLTLTLTLILMGGRQEDRRGEAGRGGG